MKIRNEGPSKPKPLKFADLVTGECYKSGQGDAVFLCAALVTGPGYNERTAVKKIVSLKEGHIFNSSHCGHMEFIHVNAEVVL